MGQDPGTRGAQVTATNQDPEQIQRDIEETREQLGDTVEALARKADVKAQAKRRIAETKATVSQKTQALRGKAKEASPASATTAATRAGHKAKENPVPVATVGALAVGFLAGRLTKR